MAAQKMQKKKPHFENQKKELPKANFSKNASHSRALWHTGWWVLQFCFEVHYVFFFGGFKHEPKYVDSPYSFFGGKQLSDD